MNVIREEAKRIIAEFEHRMRRDGHGLRNAVERDVFDLLTNGFQGQIGATDAERKESFAAAFRRVDAARIRAEAMIRASLILTRILRAIGGTPIFDSDAIPNTARMAKQIMREEDAKLPDDRAPIKLPSANDIIASAKTNGIEVAE